MNGDSGQPAQPENEPVQTPHILSLRHEVLPDWSRMRVMLHLSPFSAPPNLVAEVLDADGTLIRHASLIEVMIPRMVFTLHLPPELPRPPYRLIVHLLSGDEEIGREAMEIDFPQR